MRNDKFDAESWVDRLSRALKKVALLQQNHGDEWDVRRALGPIIEEFDDSMKSILDFHWRAGNLRLDTYGMRYGPVQAAAAVVRSILAEHPAWAEVLDASGDGEIWFGFPNGAGVRNLSQVVAGLVECGRNSGEGSFKVACAELNLLLAAGDEQDLGPRRTELLTGCHVALFQGLIVREEIRIGDGFAVVPLGWLGDFMDASILDRLRTKAAGCQSEEYIAAVVEPFRWKPEFRGDDQSSGFDWAGASSFSEDAEVILELLALFHEVPVVGFASMMWRFHRRSCHLLGCPEQHRIHDVGVPSWPTGLAGSPVKARREAIDAVAKVFVGRDGERYRRCAPVISRLAAALARQGRFGSDDRILDVAIALEQMYELDQGEISFKLKTRAACFLEARTKDRLSVFKDVQDLYHARSGIVHPRGKKGKKAKPSNVLKEERRTAFDRGFDVARRSVIKLLNEGPPQDWNQMLLEAKEVGPEVRGSGAKTTVPGYVNRNGQTVIRRTDMPGNDYNQVVYELECGGCGERYGANGSDIWQRKCPTCGGGRPGLSLP